MMNFNALDRLVITGVLFLFIACGGGGGDGNSSVDSSDDSNDTTGEIAVFGDATFDSGYVFGE